MKVKGQILICTAIMLNDHSNPYIESTTVLSDIYIIRPSFLVPRPPRYAQTYAGSFKVQRSHACMLYTINIICSKRQPGHHYTVHL